MIRSVLLIWGHTPLYTLKLTLIIKMVLNLGPKFLTLILQLLKATKKAIHGFNIRVTHSWFEETLTMTGQDELKERCGSCIPKGRGCSLGWVRDEWKNRWAQYNCALGSHILTWRHKTLYNLTLTQTKKIILNVGPELFSGTLGADIGQIVPCALFTLVFAY